MNTKKKSPSPAEVIAQLRQENAALQAKAECLEEEIRLLRAILYGRSSEKQPEGGEEPQQTDLAFDEADSEETQENAEAEQIEITGHTRRKPGRKPIIDSLPRSEKLALFWFAARSNRKRNPLFPY
jgi:hypothetical protein